MHPAIDALRDRVQSEYVASLWDIGVLFVVFVAIIADTMQYNVEARTFPLLVLVVGMAATVVELFVRMAPVRYSQRFRRLTQGLTGGGPVDSSDEDNLGMAADESVDLRKLGSAMALIVGYAFVAYLVGFIAVLPVFTGLTIWLFGSRDLRVIVVTTAFLMAIVFLFHIRLLGMPSGGILFG